MVLKSIFTFLKDEQYRSLIFATAMVLVIGTVVYHYLEAWTWLDSLYFSVITLSTIGYGDFSPQTDLGKVFTILYIIVGVGLILGFINTVYGHFRDSNQQAKSKK
jgi:voltage-gated potassium channel